MTSPKKWLIVLQLLITGGLLTWIFSNSEFRSQIGEVLLRENPNWLLLGFLLAGLSHLLGIIRWRIFLVALEIRISFWRAAQIYLLGLFFSTFLIGMIAGDAAKALILISQGHRRSAAFLSIILDRISGLIVLVFSSVVLMLWHYDWLMSSKIIGQMMHIVLWYFGVLMGLLIISFVAVRIKLPDRIPDRVSFKWRIQEFCNGYYVFISKWPRAIAACGVSIGVTALYYAVFYCSAQAAAVNLSLSEVFAFMPMVEAIVGLPITFGGIGMREHLFTLILGELSAVPLTQAVMVSITGYLLFALWGLAGALVFPFFRIILRQAREDKLDGSIH